MEKDYEYNIIYTVIILHGIHRLIRILWNICGLIYKDTLTRQQLTFASEKDHLQPVHITKISPNMKK